MARISPLFNFLSRYKYSIVIVVGVLVVGFIDDNSFLKRIEYHFHINDLKAEIERYNTQYQEDSKRIKELNRNPKAIEKIARERYFMKADDEDIFVLSDDERPIRTQKQDETAE